MVQAGAHWSDWWSWHQATHCISQHGLGKLGVLFSRSVTLKVEWLQVEVDSSDKGALRLAREACPDVLLCEELKHLYTALTRAKNNVVVFDRNTAKRAPFFNYLRRLGMAQYVSRSATLLLTFSSTAQTHPVSVLMPGKC